MPSAPPSAGWNVSQYGDTRTPADQGVSGGGEGPIWARQVFQKWPNEKTQLVREVCRHLNSEAQDFLMAMDAPTAASVCYSLLLACPANEEGASVLMKQWAERREAFKTQPISLLPRPATPLDAGPEMEVMLIVMGLTDGRAALLTHSAAKIMQSQCGIPTSFQKSIIIAPTSHQEIHMLQTSCSLSPSVPDIDTFADLENYIERSSSEWVTRKTKFLLVNVLPPTAELDRSRTLTVMGCTSRGQDGSLMQGKLHMPSAKLLERAMWVQYCSHRRG